MEVILVSNGSLPRKLSFRRHHGFNLYDVYAASCYGSQFTSYDGTRYTYNCPGQYRLTNVASGSYQFRAEVLVDQLPGRYGTSSCTGATAISLQPSDAPLVQVSVGAGSALRVYINRVDISVTVLALLSSATTQQSAFDYSGVRCIRASAITSADQLYAVQSRYPATVVIFSRQRCRLIFRSGISINIAIQTSTGAIAISTGMPVMFRQAAIGGLLGNFDGLRSNDFRLPTGVSVTSTLRGIFTSYGPYCKLLFIEHFEIVTWKSLVTFSSSLSPCLYILLPL